MKVATAEAYKLLHEGSIALSALEQNGMRIDEDYLEAITEQVSSDIKRLEETLKKDDVYKSWKRRFGLKANIGSRQQLKTILHDVLGYEKSGETEGKKEASADQTALEKIGIPFTTNYIQFEKLKKIRSTFLRGISIETVGGYMHPFFNLHTARTYRSSSSNPNSQNFPVRNPDFAEMVRRCIIARDGHQIVEIDFSGIEVRIAACYHHDPVMMEYINNPNKDMHRDMAAQCYRCKPEQVSKDMRYCAKNMFVFPEFYGDYYVNCATHLWEACERMDLTLTNGASTKSWLKRQGIRGRGLCDRKQHTPKPGSFEEHIKEVEYDFWKRRFKVYDQWKDKWYNRYQKTGGFDTLTGFRIDGLLSRNDVINYPVQGSAFHCQLWSLIKIQKWLVKNRMKSKLVGQIHDSIIGDIHRKERDDFIEYAHRVMTKDLLEHWKWICVPIDVEVEVAPVGGSWFDKSPIRW